jgi:hypothetical protein
VRFDRVIDTMGQGVFSPVVYRPLFDCLRLVTCRTFETPAANTVPLFAQEADFVREIYGDLAEQLVLPDERPEGKIVDILRRPDRYAEVVRGLRRHLARHHSYEARLRDLIELVES